jgi:hypothetical protein
MKNAIGEKKYQTAIVNLKNRLNKLINKYQDQEAKDILLKEK